MVKHHFACQFFSLCGCLNLFNYSVIYLDCLVGSTRRTSFSWFFSAIFSSCDKGNHCIALEMVLIYSSKNAFQYCISFFRESFLALIVLPLENEDDL